MQILFRFAASCRANRGRTDDAPGHAAVLSAALLLMSACTAPGPHSDYPLYNRVYGIATHNSYWLNRSDRADLLSSGTQELLSDQLLHDHARAIELDVHSEGAPAGHWKVYHTSDSEDFTCRFLEDCLEILRSFHYAVPKHEVINVIVELKNTVSWTGVSTSGIHTHLNFASDHTITQFDDTFRNVFGSALYTPHDFLARCPPNSTMVDCASKAGWPAIDQLRGKFMINIHGNWSSAAYDLVQYASSGIKDRVAFPIQSVYEVDPSCTKGFTVTGGPGPGDANPWFRAQAAPAPPATGKDFYCIKDIDDSYDPSPPIEGNQRQAAFDASVFWQLEDLSDDGLKKAAIFLQHNGVVRGSDSYDYHPGCDGSPTECQEARISPAGNSPGFQLIQTDYPWHFVHDEGPAGMAIPTDPSQRFKDPSWIKGASPPPIHERGARLYFHFNTSYAPSPPVAWPWAFTTVPVASQRWWEATVSTTRLGDTWGQNNPLDHNPLYTRCEGGILLCDYIQTCPRQGQTTQKYCTNYARRAQEWSEGGIRVGSADFRSWVMIGRRKTANSGASYDQENVGLYVRQTVNGTVLPDRLFTASRYGPCWSQGDPNSDGVFHGCIGSMIALSVDNQQSRSVVTVYSASKVDAAWQPIWTPLATVAFDVPMTKQGFNAVGDVLFAGQRTGIRGRANLQPVALSDLPGRQLPSGAAIVDLSSSP